jgi:hypothetical protein
VEISLAGQQQASGRSAQWPDHLTQSDGRDPRRQQGGRKPAVNANDAILTELATAQSGSMVADNVPTVVFRDPDNIQLELIAFS